MANANAAEATSLRWRSRWRSRFRSRSSRSPPRSPACSLTGTRSASGSAVRWACCAPARPLADPRARLAHRDARTSCRALRAAGRARPLDAARAGSRRAVLVLVARRWTARRDRTAPRWASRGELAELHPRGPRPGVSPWATRRQADRSGAQGVGARRRARAVREEHGLIVPAILEWTGPALSTSIKSDVVHDTHGGRRGGEVFIFDPTGSTGLHAHAVVADRRRAHLGGRAADRREPTRRRRPERWQRGRDLLEARRRQVPRAAAARRRTRPADDGRRPALDRRRRRRPTDRAAQTQRGSRCPGRRLKRCGQCGKPTHGFART